MRFGPGDSYKPYSYKKVSNYFKQSTFTRILNLDCEGTYALCDVLQQ